MRNTICAMFAMPLLAACAGTASNEPLAPQNSPFGTLNAAVQIPADAKLVVDDGDTYFVSGGDGREFEVVVWMAEVKPEHMRGMISNQAGESAKKTAEQLAKEAAAKVSCLLESGSLQAWEDAGARTKGVLPDGIFRFRAREGARVVRPFGMLVSTVEGEFLAMPAFNPDGSRIERVGGRMRETPMGLFADFKISKMLPDGTLPVEMRISYRDLDQIWSGSHLKDGLPGKQAPAVPLFSSREINNSISLFPKKNEFTFLRLGGLTREDTVADADGNERRVKYSLLISVAIREI